jgi:hypothetical protein
VPCSWVLGGWLTAQNVAALIRAFIAATKQAG